MYLLKNLFIIKKKKLRNTGSDSDILELGHECIAFNSKISSNKIEKTKTINIQRECIYKFKICFMYSIYVLILLIQ